MSAEPESITFRDLESLPCKQLALVQLAIMRLMTRGIAKLC
jgi:hypothetical protein